MAAWSRVRHLPIGLVLVLAGVANAGNLSNAFLGSDTWPWLVSTRVDSAGDVVRVAFSPIMSGTSFVAEVALFYHPLTALTYSLDQALFGLHPFGFYATNLLIHLVAVGLLYTLARSLGASWWAASVCALILAMHPIAAATVPSLPRRQDMLVGALLLGSMTLLARAGIHAGGISRPRILGALALFFLALGGKEIAYAGLAVVPFIVTCAWLPMTRMRMAWTSVVLVVAGFVLVEALAFAIRWRVLGGLGGYYGSSALLGSSSGILEYFVRPYITYALWPIQPVMPERLRDWLIAAGLVAAVVGVAVAGLRIQRRLLAVVGVVWQAAFLVLYAIVHTSLGPYLLYVPLAGLALLVAALLDGVADRFRTGIYGRGWRRLGDACAVLAAGGATLLLLGIVRTSALLTDYPEFRDASFVSQQFIDQAIPCFAAVPVGGIVHVDGLPHRIDYESPASQFVDVFVFESYSLEAVVRLRVPASRARRIDVRSSQDVLVRPTNVVVTCSPQGDDRQISVQLQN